ncbi:MAG: tyrosine-protein phosphatase [Paludibacteraceae bacterium]|nr:tyrosine-protein phosphatase [Paludibacteraceae bacterium]
MKRIIWLAIICISIVGMSVVSVHAFQSGSTSKTSTTTRPSNWAEPITLAGVPNLYKVTDNLYRSAQPTAEGMSNLTELGIKTIVNLRSNHSDTDEIGDLPLKTRRIEIFAGNMKDEYVEEFLSIVNDTSAVPVLVHCQHGADRTGMVCAMYRTLCQGWTPDEAINEMQNGGYGFHSIWSNIPLFVRESTNRFLAKKQ